MTRIKAALKAAQDLDALEQRRRDAAAAEIARIKQEVKEFEKAVSAERQRRSRGERAERERRTRQMAFAIGHFLLRNGADDPTVKAIVKTDAFDEFMSGVKMRGLREVFGLPAPSVSGERGLSSGEKVAAKTARGAAS